MKWLILLVLFAPVFYFAFRHKKWYLYLPCALVGVLPDQFAIELSSSLPLLTFSRVLILILFGFWVVKKFKHWKFHIPLAVALYFGVGIAISVINTRFGVMNEVKNIAITIMEELLVILMVTDLIEDRIEFDRCLDALVLSGVALSIIGIVQTIFEFDVTTVMQLVEARSATMLTLRMGMIRASGTTNALIYGCYCAFMAMIIFFRLERTGKQRYALALALDVIALLCTMSRSSWLALGVAIILLMVTRPRKTLRRIWTTGVAIILIFTTLCFINSHFKVAMVGTAVSSANTVLKPFGIELKMPSFGGEDGEDLEEEFGDNANNAARSRTVEWTAVTYMIDEGEAVFGYGYNAFPRGKLHYFYPQFGFWTVAGTLDVGLLATVTESGFVGLIAQLAFLAYVFINALIRRGKRGTFTFNKLVVYTIPLYLVLNFMSAFSGPFWVFLGLFFASRKLRLESQPDTGISAPTGKFVF